MFVLLALMSAGASAHAGHGNVHKVGPKVADVHHSAVQEKQSPEVIHGAAIATEATHLDTCDHSHCGHAQLAGLLTRDASDWSIDTASNVPTPRTSWATNHITNNIERPKWPATTPAVVNLQS